MVGLLVLENYGEGFTKEQQAELWKHNFSPSNGSFGAY
ncbi:hypothetical protein ABIA45_007385 [Bradyrhizobium sp. USDA 336]